LSPTGLLASWRKRYPISDTVPENESVIDKKQSDLPIPKNIIGGFIWP
jgi:hypothetical protein